MKNFVESEVEKQTTNLSRKIKLQYLKYGQLHSAKSVININLMNNFVFPYI